MHYLITTTKKLYGTNFPKGYTLRLHNDQYYKLHNPQGKLHPTTITNSWGKSVINEMISRNLIKDYDGQ